MSTSPGKGLMQRIEFYAEGAVFMLAACKTNSGKVTTLRNVSRFDIVCGMFWNEASGSEFLRFPGLLVRKLAAVL